MSNFLEHDDPRCTGVWWFRDEPTIWMREPTWDEMMDQMVIECLECEATHDASDLLNVKRAARENLRGLQLERMASGQ